MILIFSPFLLKGFKMATSDYQHLKLQIVDLIGLSKDAIHIYIGLSLLLFTVIFWGKGRVTLTCLIPVFIAALGMEVMDLYDDYYSVGFFRWFNSFHDVVNTSLWPTIIVVLVKLKYIKIAN